MNIKKRLNYFSWCAKKRVKKDSHWKTLDESKKKSTIRFHTLDSIRTLNDWMYSFKYIFKFINYYSSHCFIPLYGGKVFRRICFFSPLWNTSSKWFDAVWWKSFETLSIVLQIGDSVNFANMTKKTKSKIWNGLNRRLCEISVSPNRFGVQ